VDVGGQRSERKKWAGCFEGVTAIVYVLSLSEYDQCLREDEFLVSRLYSSGQGTDIETPPKNRMNEARELFRNTINNPHLQNATLVLFFNKFDILKEKLPNSPLEDFFPDYTGGNNVDAAVEYIRNMYRKEIKPEGRKVYEHVTCATDKQGISSVIIQMMKTLP
jgi:guanine nucleotide-binding protein subunit alpha